MTDLVAVYQDLHAHPELSFQEHRTAAVVVERLTALRYAVTSGVGGTGVVGVLHRGSGPTVLLRADMDALPVCEETGLPYASSARSVDANGVDVPVMHACGHDIHVTCLLGAAEQLARPEQTWQGTVMLVFQPAEETGAGARAMVDDGLFTRFGTPDVVLGQHVAPLPAGVIGLADGPAFAAADSLRIRVFGRGAHGSRPEASVDPVVLAASIVLRLQTIVSREVAATDVAVVTVGSVHTGTKANIIPDDAELLVNVRSYDEAVRTRVLSAIERIVRAECAASGSPRDPVIENFESLPSVVNDRVAGDRVRAAWSREGSVGLVVAPGAVTGSEDVGHLATSAGAPCVYWLLGGADPALFAGAGDMATLGAVVAGLPSNHSPQFAPVAELTIPVGVASLVGAAHAWLSVPADPGSPNG